MANDLVKRMIEDRLVYEKSRLSAALCFGNTDLEFEARVAISEIEESSDV